MAIVDQTGRPVRPTLSDEDIVQAFNQIVQRIQFQHNQITFTGLTIEYIFKVLEEKLNVKIDNAEVQAYMQKRVEEVKAEAENIASEMEETFTNTEINLDDE